MRGDGGDGGVVGDIERGDAVEVFLEFGEWAFAVLAVHDRAIIGKALGGVGYEAEEVIQYGAGNLCGRVGEALLVVGGESLAEFVGEGIAHEGVWLRHGEDGEVDAELAGEVLAAGVVLKSERAVFVVAFLLQPDVVAVEPLLGKVAVGGGVFAHGCQPFLALGFDAHTDIADAVEGHVFVKLARLALAGGEVVEAVAPELLHGFERLLAGVEVVGEVLGEFVVGLGLAGASELDSGLPEGVHRSFKF